MTRRTGSVPGAERPWRVPQGRVPGGLPGRVAPGHHAGAVDQGFHCARTQWIRGFMLFRLVRRIRTMMLMVPV